MTGMTAVCENFASDKYLTGQIMTVDYAEAQNLFSQYSFTEIFTNINLYFHFLYKKQRKFRRTVN